MSADLIPYTFAKRHGVLITEQTETLATVVYHANPKLAILTELRRHLNCPINLRIVSQEEFEILLTKVYESDSSAARQVVEDIGEGLELHQLIEQIPKTEDLLESQNDAPIIRLLNALLTQAIKQKASDIHIETFETIVIIRFRVDGILHEVLQIPRIVAPLIISRIKVMAKLDIAEKRIPQDGRISLRIAGHTVDVRVSTMLANHGERIVLRLLDKKVARLDLTLLGMADDTSASVQKLIAIPHGIILVTGPTGSGKSTSLYAMLTSLNKVNRNILTVEDPIEYDLQGIGQTQVNPKVNMSFAKGLRAILRQDPDVVMVGEIRDLETAEIAVQASLTGHLVLSTLHTNSAIGAITRLRDMGVEEFLLASSLIGVIAQRLVRVLCPHCKIPHQATPSELEVLGAEHTNPITLYRPGQCDACNNLGYQGRTGIYEAIAIDEKLASMIHANTSEQEMENYARTYSRSIRQDGLRRVLAGETSLAEVLRVTNED